MANILLGNAFPFAREGAVRSSLENLGKLLDMGWSILIYPEGDRFLGGREEFTAGTGLIAVGSLTPVIPVRVKLLKGTIFDRGSLLSRGKVEIHFGEPLTFSRRTSPVDATRRLEEAVRAL
jgi:long-chain acyl-CoA synthetase